MNARAREGDFASCNPRTQVLAGPDAVVAAEPDGLIVGRFGWANLYTGLAQNTRLDPSERLGFVLPVCGDWQRVYLKLGTRILRPGMPATLCVRGDFWARFPDGAIIGQPVYASLVDGSAISGYAAGAELTPWTVALSCAPGQIAIISTWSKFP